MHLYRTLDSAYQQLANRPHPPGWQAGHESLDGLVETIRDDQPDPTRSDTTLRHLLAAGCDDPDAWTVVLYALAPALRARTGRAVTGEYRDDALTDLAFVLADAIGTDRPGLAHRLVNRAHNRTYKAAGRVHERGSTDPVVIAPTDPARFAFERSPGPDIAELVAHRVDLDRFHAAVQTAIGQGALPESQWAAYRAHRLARAVDPTQPACDGTQRQLACRAERRIQPLVDTYLHAA